MQSSNLDVIFCNTAPLASCQISCPAALKQLLTVYQLAEQLFRYNGNFLIILLNCRSSNSAAAAYSGSC
jgi:hypothetical protein